MAVHLLVQHRVVVAALVQPVPQEVPVVVQVVLGNNLVCQRPLIMRVVAAAVLVVVAALVVVVVQMVGQEQLILAEGAVVEK
jgi:hypothetical protein